LSGAPGAERLRVELMPDEPAPARPGKGAGRAMKAGKGVKAGKKVERVAAVVVEFALADVVKAKLVPELHFRGTGKDGAEGEKPRGANTGSKKQ
jgi:hypothetical protein